MYIMPVALSQGFVLHSPFVLVTFCIFDLGLM